MIMVKGRVAFMNVFAFLPEWVSSRLTVVARDFKSEQFDFFICNLHEDQSETDNNTAIAYFLTVKELIRVYCKIKTISIEKYKLENVVKIYKFIETPIDDKFTDEEVKCFSVDVYLNNEDSLSLEEPTLKTQENIQRYKRFVSKL